VDIFEGAVFVEEGFLSLIGGGAASSSDSLSESLRGI
jgi:hypothetical protein